MSSGSGSGSAAIVVFATVLACIVTVGPALAFSPDEEAGFYASPDELYGTGELMGDGEDDVFFQEESAVSTDPSNAVADSDALPKAQPYLVSGFDAKVAKYFEGLQGKLRQNLREKSKLDRVRATIKAYWWILTRQGRKRIWKNMKHAMFTAPPRAPSVASTSTNERWYGNRLESGTVTANLNPKQQTKRGTIKFKRAFDAPPQVSMSLRSFSIGAEGGGKQQERKALDASVTSVTSTGFEYLIQGWGESVKQAKASWVAYGGAIKSAKKKVKKFATTYERLYRTNYVKDELKKWRQLEKIIQGFYARRYQRMRRLATQVNSHKGYWKQYMAIHKRLLIMNHFIKNQETAEKKFSDKITAWRDKVVKEMKLAPMALLASFHKSLYYDKKMKKIMPFIKKETFTTFLDLRKRMKDAWKNAADLVKAITEMETGVRDYSLHLTDRIEEGKKIKEAQLDEGAIEALRQRGLNCHCTKATGATASKCVCADPGGANNVANADPTQSSTSTEERGLGGVDIQSVIGNK